MPNESVETFFESVLKGLRLSGIYGGQSLLDMKAATIETVITKSIVQIHPWLQERCEKILANEPLISMRNFMEKLRTEEELKRRPNIPLYNSKLIHGRPIPAPLAHSQVLPTMDPRRMGSHTLFPTHFQPGVLPAPLYHGLDSSMPFLGYMGPDPIVPPPPLHVGTCALCQFNGGYCPMHPSGAVINLRETPAQQHQRLLQHQQQQMQPVYPQPSAPSTPSQPRLPGRKRYDSKDVLSMTTFKDLLLEHSSTIMKNIDEKISAPVQAIESLRRDFDKSQDDRRSSRSPSRSEGHRPERLRSPSF